MAEETDIKTPAEVADSFGRNETDTPKEAGYVDINEEMVRLNQKIAELNQRVRDAEQMAVDASNAVECQAGLIDDAERNIDVLDGAIKNTRGATDKTKVTHDADGAIIVDAGVQYPFEVVPDTTYVSSPTTRRVSVRDGIVDVIKGGVSSVTQIALGTGVPTSVTAVGVDILTNTTAYVYLSIFKSAATEEGNMAEAGVVAVAQSATRPVETDIANGQPHCVRVLAKCVNTAGNLVITQEWTGGDIKVKAMVHDADDLFNVVVDGERMKSITHDNLNRDTLYGFQAASNGHVPYALRGGNNRTLTWEYSNMIDGLADKSLSDVPFSISADSQYITAELYDYHVGTGSNQGIDGFSEFKDSEADLSIDIWSMMDAYAEDETTPFIHPHTNHTWGVDTDDHDGTEAGDSPGDPIVTARYLEVNSDHTRNDMGVGSGIGDNTGTISISPDLRTLYGKWHSNETDASDTVIANNSLYSLGGVAWTNGGYGTKGTGGQALKLTDGTDTVKIVDGTYAIDVTNGGIKVSANGFVSHILTDDYSFGFWTDLDINANGNYYHNTVQGQSITNWFGGGILTGTVTEIDGDDLRATDKLLVIR